MQPFQTGVRLNKPSEEPEDVIEFAIEERRAITRDSVGFYLADDLDDDGVTFELFGQLVAEFGPRPVDSDDDDPVAVLVSSNTHRYHARYIH